MLTYIKDQLKKPVQNNDLTRTIFKRICAIDPIANDESNCLQMIMNKKKKQQQQKNSIFMEITEASSTN